MTGRAVTACVALSVYGVRTDRGKLFGGLSVPTDGGERGQEADRGAVQGDRQLSQLVQVLVRVE